jgi:hypothetical protein
MKQYLEDERYSTASIIRFLHQLKQYSPVSLCSALVFTAFEMAIMHVLQFGNNSGQNAEVHRLAKEIMLRAIECGPNQTGRLPLEFCFKEVLEILTNNDMEMGEVWKAMALVRSEIFLN